MRKKIQDRIYNFSYIAEIVISLIIFIIIALGVARVAMDLINPDISWNNADALGYFLNRLLMLAVATEFIKMLCRHTASSVIEVLLFATARQMIVEHYSPVETLISVVAIACLFATRKYLLRRSDEKENEADHL
ncbi:MAG: phosphate-starvation-inducible PsiE family protein [[Bacteroides] pectinophilus]|nr:phosphate-starvation-inducible PsiE family protein [[Bacteroides] pectinophilus]